jgi:antitoxin (DNA-binding transcriptional repressor) of toxin-antitoxin stability system
MNVAVSDAQAVLLELARKAVSGEEIVLTRHGHAIARIVGVQRGAARLVAWGRRGARIFFTMTAACPVKGSCVWSLILPR